MAWTSPITINATQGLDSFLPYLTEVSNYWFGRMILITVFIVFLFGYLRAKDDDFWSSLAVASYVTFIISLLFWTIGVVSGIDFGIVVGITVVSSIILFMNKNN